MNCYQCSKKIAIPWMTYKQGDSVHNLCSYLCYSKTTKQMRFQDIVNKNDFMKDPLPFYTFQKPKPPAVSEFQFLSDRELKQLTDVELSKYERELRNQFLLNSEKASYALEMVSMSEEFRGSPSSDSDTE